MGIRYERFASIKDAPSDSEVTRIHSLLIADTGFFVDRELIFLLSRPEVSTILGIPMQRNDVGDSILGDLITREEIREWSNLPEMHKSPNGRIEGISLLSVFEYMVKHDGGIVKSPGEFPSDGNQVALQKDVLGRILAQVSDWKTRVFYNEAA